MKKIDKKDKWTVNEMLDEDSNKIPWSSDYFGNFVCVKCDGKKAIVYCDGRDAIVHQITEWYDEIYYGNPHHEVWSGDTRWNNDRPVVVKDKRGYNLLEHDHTRVKELLEQSLPYIDTSSKWKYSREIETYYLSAKDSKGKDCIVAMGGLILDYSALLSTKETLEILKNMPIENIEQYWIRKGGACAYVRGLRWKGAKACFVSTERALELFKTHKRFEGMFNSAEWDIIEGIPALLFRDYCDSDYD